MLNNQRQRKKCLKVARENMYITLKGQWGSYADFSTETMEVVKQQISFFKCKKKIIVNLEYSAKISSKIKIKNIFRQIKTEII